MNKSELVLKCREMGIKGVSNKTKNEILLLIKKHEQNQEKLNFNITENKFTDVMKELIIKTQKDVDNLPNKFEEWLRRGYVYADGIFR